MVGNALKKNDDKPILRSFNLFFAIFLVFGSILAGLGAIFYRSEIETFVGSTSVQEGYRVELLEDLIGGLFDDVVSDLLVLASQSELSRFLDQGEPEALSVMASEYVAFSRLKGQYDQLRFLDTTGQELVRVNYNEGSPVVVPPEGLQDKGKRYYFTDTLALQAGEVFVSPFDLNIEHGVLERPLKPMIRLGTPVVDAAGEKRGIVLINYLGAAMLERLSSASISGFGEIMLLNADGFWLRSPHHEDEWGFMIDDRAGRSFARDFPAEWSAIQAQGRGQLSTDRGLFNFVTIHPLAPGYRSSTGAKEAEAPSDQSLAAEDYVWVLVSLVHSEVIAQHTQRLMIRLFLLGSVLFVLISVGAWYLALAVTRRRIYEAQLVTLAHYDHLTELPNRTLFFDRLQQMHENALRYQRRYGLLYLDLDGFKEVNDTFGHQAGDRLLTRVGAVLRKGVRKADTVARLGGDEFAVILSDVSHPQTALALGEKLVSLVSGLDGFPDAEVDVGASAGIALYPDDARSPDELVRKADQAMYLAKKRGKNHCERYREAKG